MQSDSERVRDRSSIDGLLDGTGRDSDSCSLLLISMITAEGVFYNEFQTYHSCFIGELCAFLRN